MVYLNFVDIFSVTNSKELDECLAYSVDNSVVPYPVPVDIRIVIAAILFGFSLTGEGMRIAIGLKRDQVAEVVEDWKGEIEEVATMETELPSTGAEPERTVIPVCLESRLTEVGTLELWCVTRDRGKRWKLEFNLRERRQE